MAKFCGNIGFGIPSTVNGISSETIVTKKYHGDILKITRRVVSADKVNDDILITDQISIVADKFVRENYQWIRFVVLHGIKWKVASASIDHPRITLELGGLYNGQSN